MIIHINQYSFSLIKNLQWLYATLKFKFNSIFFLLLEIVSHNSDKKSIIFDEIKMYWGCLKRLNVMSSFSVKKSGGLVKIECKDIWVFP